MSDLVIIEENKACTTSLAMANGLDVQHASVLKLIKRYKSDFECTNLVRFEIQARPEGQHGGGVSEIAILDEYQATLLLTYMRNTVKVRLFKQQLVQAFFKARDLLMTGQMGLLQKHAILILALGDEKEVASSCGKGLSDWKRKRDSLQAAIQSIERQIQPQLTNFE